MNHSKHFLRLLLPESDITLGKEKHIPKLVPATPHSPPFKERGDEEESSRGTKYVKETSFNRAEESCVSQPNLPEISFSNANQFEPAANRSAIASPWFTAKEAAEYLRVSTNSIYTMVSRRQLKRHVFGSHRSRFHYDDLVALIKNRSE